MHPTQRMQSETHDIHRRMEILQIDYQDASRRASVLSAANIQLKDELARLKANVAIAGNNAKGSFNVDAFRLEQLQSEMDKMESDYRKEMVNAIVYQKEMMREMENLKTENVTLRKEIEGLSIASVPINGQPPKARNVSPHSHMKSLEKINILKAENFELSKKLSYAEVKMKNTVKHVTAQFREILVEKEKELLKLRRKIAAIEGEKDSQSQVIHSQLASLLSATDMRNPENTAASKDKQKSEIQTLRNRLKENETMYKLRFQQMMDERTQLELELEQAHKSLEELKS